MSIVGTVYFKGLPCKSGNYKVPPCSGPYPHYKIEVYTENRNIVCETLTNSKGEFKLLLPDGKYVIFTQAGAAKDVIKANAFSVEKGNMAKQLNLVVDKGIR